MLVGAAQTIFAPIASSAEYIGSQIYFDSVPPGHEIPMGYVSHAAPSLSMLAEGDDLSAFEEDYRSSLYGGGADYTSGVNDGAAAGMPKPSTTTFSLLHTRIGDTGLLLHPFFSKLLGITARGSRRAGGGGASVGQGIQTLDLSFCALTANAFDTIFAIMDSLPNLQRLYLTGNTFSLPMKVVTTGMTASHIQKGIMGSSDTHAGRQSIVLSSSAEGHDDEEEGLGGAAAAKQFMDVTSHHVHDAHDDDYITPLDDFVALLCHHWERHPSLSVLVLDPWIVSGHARFRAIRQQRVSMQRWQALSATLGATGYEGPAALLAADGSSPARGARSNRLSAGNPAAGLSAAATNPASNGGSPDTMPATRTKRPKKKDLLDDDEDDDDDKPFANTVKTVASTVLADLLPLRQQNRKQFLREALTQLLVSETNKREVLRTEEIALHRALMTRANASLAAARNGIVLERGGGGGMGGGGGSRATVRMSLAPAARRAMGEGMPITMLPYMQAGGAKAVKHVKAMERQVAKFMKFESQLRFENEKSEESYRERLMRERTAAHTKLLKRLHKQ